METVLLENCIKQYQILLTALKEYLQNMYKEYIQYDEIKHNLFSAIKMINTAEMLMNVYSNENK